MEQLQQTLRNKDGKLEELQDLNNWLNQTATARDTSLRAEQVHARNAAASHPMEYAGRAAYWSCATESAATSASTRCSRTVRPPLTAAHLRARACGQAMRYSLESSVQSLKEQMNLMQGQLITAQQQQGTLHSGHGKKHH